MSDSSQKRFSHYGADIAGAAVGFALDSLASGKLDPGLGGPVGVVVASTIKEIADRVMSSRERKRVDGVALYAFERIEERLIAGHVPRSDGFFEAQGQFQSHAEELFEGVLLKARDEYQEKKLPHFALFYTNLSFNDQITPYTANLLLASLERLTYRQLCILSLIGCREQVDFEAVRRPSHDDPELEALKREEMELHSAADIGFYGLLDGVGSWVDKLSVLGKLFFTLSGLDELPLADRQEVEDLIAGCAAGYVSTDLNR